MKKLMLTCLLASICVAGFAQILPDWNNLTPGSGVGSPLARQGKTSVGTWYFPDDPTAWYGSGNAPYFEVLSSNALGTGAGNYALVLTTGGHCGGNIIRQNKWLIRNTNGTSPLDGWTNTNIHDGISVDTSYQRPGITTKTWWERNPGDDIQAWGNGSTTYMKLKQGKLSIGPPSGNSPQYNLEVTDASSANSMVYSISNNRAATWVVNNQTSYGLTIEDTVGHLVHGMGSNAKVLNFKYDFTNSRPKVWIGTQKPTGTHSDFNFSVDGKIVAKSIYVTAPGSWADYVFADGYRLPSLKEVEAYYKANKHLSEIPSAHEVGGNGIDLGSMNGLLLKKVEELTIYVVELNKKIEALEQKNNK